MESLVLTGLPSPLRVVSDPTKASAKARRWRLLALIGVFVVLGVAMLSSAALGDDCCLGAACVDLEPADCIAKGGVALRGNIGCDSDPCARTEDRQNPDEAAKADQPSTRKTVLDEITVSAEKRDQALQDVSVAITAIDGGDLQNGLIENIENLQEVATSVSAGDDFAFAKLFVRGIGLSTGFPGVDPPIAMHVDGAVISQAYAQLGSFFDLERIEVLRGPQGTLYGRNATGGSLNLVTRKPKKEFGGYARLTVGTYDLLLSEGALTGSITPKISGRLAFRTNTRSGYGINEVDGRDVDDARKQSLRGHLQFNFNNEADFLLTAEYNTEDDASLGLKFLEVTSAIDPRLPQAPGVGGFAEGARNVASEADYRNNRETWTLNAALSWRLGNRFSMRSITNYRELDVLLKQDLDFSRNINDDVQNITTAAEQFSEELQLHYEDQRLRGLVGLYYFTEDFVNRNNIGFDRASDGTLTFALFTGDIDVDATAIFAHFVYDVSDQIALNFGGRFSNEERGGDTSQFFRFSDFGLPDRDVSFSDRRSFTNFSPTIALEWRPSGSYLTYLKYSEGFKSGTFSSGQQVPVLDPETIRSHEIGLKSTLLEGRLYLNLAGFYYEITDLQVDRALPVAGGGLMTVFENAAAAEGKGVEVDLSWLPKDRFRLTGNVAYLDARFTEYTTASNLSAVPVLVHLSGNHLRQSPEWSGYLRGEYGLTLSNDGYLLLGAEASYKGDQFYTEFNDGITGQEAYTLINASIRYIAPNGKFSVNLWGKNLADEFVHSGANPLASTRTIGVTYLPPMTAGITFGYDF